MPLYCESNNPYSLDTRVDLKSCLPRSRAKIIPSVSVKIYQEDKKENGFELKIKAPEPGM